MPITGSLNSNLMTNFGFKWVPKGMKYLGIKLSQDVEEMPALNFEPVLQKIKTNLDKQGEINLTLWAKVDDENGDFTTIQLYTHDGTRLKKKNIFYFYFFQMED